MIQTFIGQQYETCMDSSLHDFIKFNFNDFDLLKHQVLQLVIEVYIWISAHGQLVMIVPTSDKDSTQPNM